MPPHRAHPAYYVLTSTSANSNIIRNIWCNITTAIKNNNNKDKTTTTYYSDLEIDQAHYYHHDSCLSPQYPSSISIIDNKTISINLLNNGKRWIKGSRERVPLDVVGSLIKSMTNLYALTSEGKRFDDTTITTTSSISDSKYNIEDEWFAISETSEFHEVALETSELQVIKLNTLGDGTTMNTNTIKFFTSVFSLICMHASGVLKTTISKLLQPPTCHAVGYEIDGKIFTIMKLCELSHSSSDNDDNDETYIDDNNTNGFDYMV